MALDFVKFISDNTTLTIAKQKDMLNDLAESFQYKDEVIDNETGRTIPNPQSKKDFVNEKINYWIKVRVRGVRQERAQRAAVIEELEL